MKNDEFVAKPFSIRNSFIVHARPLDEDVVMALRTAILIVNVHDGFFKNTAIEEKSFSHMTRVAGAGGEAFADALVDARNANKHVLSQLKAMALDGQAMNYLFNRDENSNVENTLITKILDRAVLMINPLKTSDKQEEGIRATLKRLNNEFAPFIEAELERTKTSLTSRSIPKPAQAGIFAKARRKIASLGG